MTFFLICFLWLLLLSGYVWWKARLMFRRQTMLGQKIENLQSKRINPLQLEVEKHKRLLELNESGYRRPPEMLPSKFTAQFGEDVILFDFFKDQVPGFFIEAGAYDGITFSNTYLLESLGWKGLLVEPHPRMAELCRQFRPGSFVEEYALGPDGASGTVEFTCADDPQGGAPLSFVDASREHIERCRREHCRFDRISVGVVSLNSLLPSLTESVDFVSLDVEGMELAALQGFDVSKFQPKLILVEQNWNQGDAQVEEFLKGNGYLSAGILGCNRFFTRQEHVSQLTKAISNLSG